METRRRTNKEKKKIEYGERNDDSDLSDEDEQLGIPKFCRSGGIKKKQRTDPLTQGEKNLIDSFVKKGYLIKNISRRVKRSEGVVKKYISDPLSYGTRRERKRRSKTSDEDKNRIFEFVKGKRKMTSKQIRELQVNASENAVKYFIRSLPRDDDGKVIGDVQRKATAKLRKRKQLIPTNPDSDSGEGPSVTLQNKPKRPVGRPKKVSRRARAHPDFPGSIQSSGSQSGQDGVQDDLEPDEAVVDERLYVENQDQAVAERAGPEELDDADEHAEDYDYFEDGLESPNESNSDQGHKEQREYDDPDDRELEEFLQVYANQGDPQSDSDDYDYDYDGEHIEVDRSSENDDDESDEDDQMEVANREGEHETVAERGRRKAKSVRISQNAGDSMVLKDSGTSDNSDLQVAQDPLSPKVASMNAPHENYEEDLAVVVELVEPRKFSRTEFLLDPNVSLHSKLVLLLASRLLQYRNEEINEICEGMRVFINENQTKSENLNAQVIAEIFYVFMSKILFKSELKHPNLDAQDFLKNLATDLNEIDDEALKESLRGVMNVLTRTANVFKIMSIPFFRAGIEQMLKDLKSHLGN